ncbi:MAG: cell wall hydrolase [Oscillospiraceae bacterium]|jgi:N-acetylmuramoyl-L-alanine amidase|nr:cell wall hydrolase [Oscillospiraceae bacterium]
MNTKKYKTKRLRQFFAGSLAMLSLCAGLAVQAAAAEPEEEAAPDAVSEATLEYLSASVTVRGGRLPAYTIAGRMVSGKLYLELSDFLCVVLKNDESAQITAAEGDFYFGYAGAYFLVEEGVAEYGGTLWAPAEDIATAFCARLDADTNHAILTREEGVPLWYTEEDVYWMSRIIQAESGGEPLLGQIAVGNVVMNRKNGDYYSDTVKGVIFDPGQFSPARSGSLNVNPREKAIIAAHLAMQGMAPVGNAMYFNANGSIWGGRRTFVARIEHHYFYV